MINPLVETLFDVNNAVWKKHWYDNIFVHTNELALGSMLGINRILLMLNMIETQLKCSVKEYPEDVSNRQVNNNTSLQIDFNFIVN